MFNWLDKIPYVLLVVAAIFLLLAPFKPMPHVVEKLIMLKDGTLTKPIDILDLFYHFIPTILLASENRTKFKKSVGYQDNGAKSDHLSFAKLLMSLMLLPY